MTTPLHVRMVEGSHLTSTNRRHIAHIVQAGWRRGVSGQMTYTLEPLPDQPDHWRYHIAKRERDDWNRPVVRNKRGIVRVSQDRKG